MGREITHLLLTEDIFRGVFVVFGKILEVIQVFELHGDVVCAI